MLRVKRDRFIDSYGFSSIFHFTNKSTKYWLDQRTNKLNYFYPCLRLDSAKMGNFSLECSLFAENVVCVHPLLCEIYHYVHLSHEHTLSKAIRQIDF